MTDLQGARPTPRQIDGLIERYAHQQRRVLEKRAELETEQEAADDLKQELVALVQAFGVNHAQKSKRLEGQHNTATVTVGTVVAVDDAEAKKLRESLEYSETPELMERFFTQSVTYRLVDGPQEVLKTLDLPAKVRGWLSKRLQSCFVIKTKAPSLKVEVIEPAKP